jgi:KUP system potassium uptake protein
MDGSAHIAIDDPAASADRPITVARALAALGIVYGDLGTSPLYTYQAIVEASGGHPTRTDAIGLLSLVVWSLLITVSLKYCVFVMRADNHGEGGILALMALVTRGSVGRGAWALTAMGLFGAALIYGDGIITPAISVLSALEGLNVITDVFKPYIVPMALAVLVALFAAQVKGTASIGRVFGPIMLVWFFVIGLLGLLATARHPAVAWALDPLMALGFLSGHGLASFVVIGAVFLAVTGGEALYADMGHIGRGSIRVSWYGLVLPSLLLCYAGQTALLIDDPAMSENPFFRLAPAWLVAPLVILATAATIIASQAIITGAFSLTRQAMQLGWFPGFDIRQTSDREYGQIYVPLVNWMMMVLTLILTFSFGSSDSLAGAYGSAVSTTMLLTTALLFNAMRDVWRWPAVVAVPVALGFLVIDLGFFSANMMKVREGGWIPLALGGVIYLTMTSWRAGIDGLRRSLVQKPGAAEQFLALLRSGTVPRVPGTAVFFTRSESAVPPVLVRHVEQMGALQEKIVTLTVRFEEVPRVPVDLRAVAERVADGFWHVTVRFGFVEKTDLTAALGCLNRDHCPIDLDSAVYFASLDHVIPAGAPPRLPAWRRFVFGFMYRNAVRAADRFELPADRFLEVGRQVAL